MSFTVTRPGGITDPERRKRLKAERRAAQDRVCALCPTKLSIYNAGETCGACSFAAFDLMATLIPEPEIEPQLRRCADVDCRKRFFTKTRRRLCYACWPDVSTA